MKRTLVSVVSVALVLAGCATASKDIASTYVSPMQYQQYDCAQLSAETMRIQARVVQLGGRLDEAANNDKALTGVGLVLFWPALFFLGGTKQQEAEYARLRGEYDAVQQAAVQKSCPGLVAQPMPTTPILTPAPATAPAAAPIQTFSPATVAPVASTPATSLTTSASPPVATAAAVTAPKRTGQSSNDILRMGQQSNCDPNSQAWLVGPEGAVELYSYQCNAQESWTLRCEFHIGSTSFRCQRVK